MRMTTINRISRRTRMDNTPTNAPRIYAVVLELDDVVSVSVPGC